MIAADVIGDTILPGHYFARNSAVHCFAVETADAELPKSSIQFTSGSRRNQVRWRFIGEHSAFPAELQQLMRDTEAMSKDNKGLTLLIAVGYGGQWDIAQAAARAAAEGVAVTPQAIEQRLVTAGLPAVDLMVRTGGEIRISNFLLWQLSYAELYFCDTLWPDFGADDLLEAFAWFAGRQRRFGRVPEAS